MKKTAKDTSAFPPQVRVIQGDGVNLDSIEEILLTMEKNNISADNIAFGCGGAPIAKT